MSRDSTVGCLHVNLAGFRCSFSVDQRVQHKTFFCGHFFRMIFVALLL